MSNAIDVYVGKRLKMARILRNMTQYGLGIKVGVTLQQIQKYERGYNRISASRLFLIAHTLGVGIEYFYTGLNLPSSVVITDDVLAEDGEDFNFDYDLLNNGEAITIARMYLQIRNQNMRKVLSNLIKEVVSMAQYDQPASHEQVAAD